MACNKCNSKTAHPSLLDATRSYYKSQRDEALAVLDVYFTNSVGIADHSKFLDEIKAWTVKLSEAEESLATLEKHWL